jgi:hypothetical protein
MLSALITCALTAHFTFASPVMVQDQPEPKKPALTLPAGGKWKPLFDGKSLKDWKQTEFGGGGEVVVDPKAKGGQPAIQVSAGVALSGFNWVGDTLPTTDYEISVEAMKLEGTDFFCGITFPVGESFASLILGGWGGGTVGISSIDNRDASDNETTQIRAFAKDRWFKVRVRVTTTKIEVWLDDKRIISPDIKGKKISLRRGEISYSKPLGFSTYQTKGAFRNIRLRLLETKKNPS